ncbi:MAG TPA: hypothetical protein VK116_16695 [Planctomycetota bacterium]|nr:hypothetical protein [Planctomycetota bacterium]
MALETHRAPDVDLDAPKRACRECWRPRRQGKEERTAEDTETRRRIHRGEHGEEEEEVLTAEDAEDAEEERETETEKP